MADPFPYSFEARTFLDFSVQKRMLSIYNNSGTAWRKNFLHSAAVILSIRWTSTASIERRKGMGGGVSIRDSAENAEGLKLGRFTSTLSFRSWVCSVFKKIQSLLVETLWVWFGKEKNRLGLRQPTLESFDDKPTNWDRDYNKFLKNWGALVP